MSTFKKSVLLTLMLVFMLGAGISAMLAFVYLLDPTMSSVEASDYVPVILFFCFMMFFFFVGMCAGVLLWVLAMRLFVPKEDMYEVLISDPKSGHAYTAGFLESLLDLIF